MGIPYKSDNLLLQLSLPSVSQELMPLGRLATARRLCSLREKPVRHWEQYTGALTRICPEILSQFALVSSAAIRAR